MITLYIHFPDFICGVCMQNQSSFDTIDVFYTILPGKEGQCEGIRRIKLCFQDDDCEESSCVNISTYLENWWWCWFSCFSLERNGLYISFHVTGWTSALRLTLFKVSSTEQGTSSSRITLESDILYIYRYSRIYQRYDIGITLPSTKPCLLKIMFTYYKVAY